ncbi:MAG: PAS domain S-box protein [Bacteroidales bacterium]|nr:PAS domain S-box protein [Bacteroidales bacterium]
MSYDLNRFRTVFEKAPLGIFITTREGQFIELNHRLAQILGYASVDEVKKCVNSIGDDIYVNSQVREDVKKQIDITGDVAEFETQYKKKDGQVIDVRLFISIYSEDRGSGSKYIGMVEDISEKKNLQKRLKEREILLSSIIHCLPFEFWVFDRQEVIMAQSDYSKKKWGDYVGRHSREIPSDVGSVDDRDARIEKVLAGETLDFMTSVDIGGETNYIRCFMSPLRDEEKVKGVIDIIFNHTDKVRAEKRVAEIHEFLKVVINSIPVRIFWMDTNLEYSGANLPFLQDLDLKSESELKGKPDFDFVADRQADFVRDFYLEVIRTRKPRLNIKTWIVSSNKRRLFVLASVIPLLSKNGERVDGVMTCFQDITILKQMEDELILHRNNLEQLVEARTKEVNMLNDELLASNQELNVLNEVLSNQKDELEQTLFRLKSTQEKLVQSEKMASLGVMTAGVAHEINNPLNFISSGMHGLESIVKEIDQITQEILDDMVEGQSGRKRLMQYLLKDMNDLISTMYSGVERTTNIVKGLRLFSRMDTEEKSPADVHEILEVALLILNKKYVNRVEIKRNYGVLPKIRCFPGKLSQVFVNLLMNAFQAIPKNGVVEISTRVIDKGKLAEIVIWDNGIGIPENLQQKIFDPFFTTKPVKEGTGMGLSIVYSIIADHKGDISFESNSEKGTTFRVILSV